MSPVIAGNPFAGFLILQLNATAEDRHRHEETSHLPDALYFSSEISPAGRFMMRLPRTKTRRPMMRKLTIFLLLSFGSGIYAQQRPVVKIWPGKAPGSEEWTFSEKVATGPDGTKIYSNIVEPTLTAFLPDPAKANGVAVVLCPGGAMRMLAFNEPEQTAQKLNARGVAAFILKYRVVPDAAPATRPPSGPPSGPPGQRAERTLKDLLDRHGNSNPSPENQAHTTAIAMSVADGQQAIRLLRRNAAEYRLDTKRIGILGFSAGGGVALGTALAEASDGYPDFVATIYGPSLMEVNVPKHGAPLFIACLESHLSVPLTAVFALWKEAGRPVEIHVYDHAYGPASGMPIANWTDRLLDWFVARKIIAK
jgi:acetyl esterase/lipase